MQIGDAKGGRCHVYGGVAERAGLSHGQLEVDGPAVIGQHDIATGDGQPLVESATDPGGDSNRMRQRIAFMPGNPGYGDWTLRARFGGQGGA